MIAVQASGGETPYQYNYGLIQNNFVSANTMDNLPFGTYQITVRDASGCEVTESTSIDSLRLEPVASSPQNASCFGFNDGSIVIEETNGGIAPFTYAYRDSSGGG